MPIFMTDEYAKYLKNAKSNKQIISNEMHRVLLGHKPLSYESRLVVKNDGLDFYLFMNNLDQY